MPVLNPHDLQAVWLSIKVAGFATVIATPLGFAVAYLLAFSKMPGKAVVEGIVNLPLVLPPVVVGYLLLIFLGQHGVVGPFLSTFGIRIIFTLAGAVVASAVVGFPLLVRALRLGLESIDERCLQAARTLGAGRLDVLCTITLPMCGRAVLAGMTLMFARSLGEFGATIILAGNIPGVTQTIPLAIYEYTNTPGGDRLALQLCLVSICLSFAVLLLSEAINRKIDRR